MTCDGLKRTIEARDVDRRPSPAALQKHLARCPRCRSAFPELVHLYAVKPGTRPRRRPVVVAAAAAVFVGVVAVATMFSSTLRSSPPRTETPLRAVAWSISATVEERRVVVSRNGPVAFRTRIETWRAPRPRILEGARSPAVNGE